MNGREKMQETSHREALFERPTMVAAYLEEYETSITDSQLNILNHS